MNLVNFYYSHFTKIEMANSFHNFNMCIDDCFKMIFFINNEICLRANEILCKTLCKKILNNEGF